MSNNNPYPSTHKFHTPWDWLYKHEVPLTDEAPNILRWQGYMYFNTKEGLKDTPIWNDIYAALQFMRDDFFKKYHFKTTDVLTAMLDKMERKKDWESAPHPYNKLIFQVSYKPDGNLYGSLSFHGYEWVGDEMREISTFTLEGKIDDGPRPKMPKRMDIESIARSVELHYKETARNNVTEFMNEKRSIDYSTYPFEPAVFSGSAPQPKHRYHQLLEYLLELPRQLPSTIRVPGGNATFNHSIVSIIRDQLMSLYRYNQSGDPGQQLRFHLTPNVQKFDKSGYTQTTLEKSTISLTLNQNGKLAGRGEIFNISGKLYILP